MERHVLLRGNCRQHHDLCRVVRAIWPEWLSRSDDYPDGSQTRFLLSVALRDACPVAATDRNPTPSNRSGGVDWIPASAAFPFWRGRKELETQTHCGRNSFARRSLTWDIDSHGGLLAMESRNEWLEWRSGPGGIPQRTLATRTARLVGLPGETVPQLSFDRWFRRQARPGARQDCNPDDARPTCATSNPGRRQHARLWKEPESGGSDGAGFLLGNAASSQSTTCPRCGSVGGYVGRTESSFRGQSLKICGPYIRLS